MLDHHTGENYMKFRIHGYSATSKIRLSEFGQSLILYTFPHDLHLQPIMRYHLIFSLSKPHTEQLSL